MPQTVEVDDQEYIDFWEKYKPNIIFMARVKYKKYNSTSRVNAADYDDFVQAGRIVLLRCINSRRDLPEPDFKRYLLSSFARYIYHKFYNDNRFYDSDIDNVDSVRFEYHVNFDDELIAQNLFESVYKRLTNDTQRIILKELYDPSQEVRSYYLTAPENSKWSIKNGIYKPIYEKLNMSRSKFSYNLCRIREITRMVLMEQKIQE